jgi:hypothetical protein
LFGGKGLEFGWQGSIAGNDARVRVCERGRGFFLRRDWELSMKQPSGSDHVVRQKPVVFVV